MKQLLAILAAVLVGFNTQAVDRITATITVTNPPVTGNSITINSGVRYWTNASAASTIQTNLVGKNQSATNLYDQIANNPYSGGVIVRWSTTNEIKLIGPLGGALAGSLSGNWGTLTLSTQSGPGTYTAIYPFENITGETNRTNQASAFTAGISAYSTNAFTTNAAAMTNFLTKGASALQEVIAPALFSGGLRGANVRLTNGFTSALTNINPVTSNLVNYGNAIRSEGSGGNSFQAGSNALAVGNFSVAIGNGSIASNTTTLAIGTEAKATNSYAMAVGNSATAGGVDTLAVGRGAQAFESSALAVGQGSIAQGTGAVALQSEVTGNSSVGIGPSSSVSATNATALGSGTSVVHNDSTALGRNATTTATNQIRMGTATETVSIPGTLEISGTQSATIFAGTNLFQLAVSYAVTNISSLANGANDLDPGLKTYIKVSGPSAAYSIDKIDRGYDGRRLTIQKTDSYTLTIPNNSGAGVLGDTAKILTGTGGTLTITNNPGFVELIYDAGASRWGVISKSN